MPSYTGRCFCGQAEWTTEIEKPETILCHCDTCKKLSGAPYTLNQIVPKQNFQLTKGTLSSYDYKGDSGNAVHCYYCPTCTAHAYHVQDVQAQNVIVRTILLDEGKSFKPAAEIYGKAKLSWEPEIAHTFDVLPPS